MPRYVFIYDDESVVQYVVGMCDVTLRKLERKMNCLFYKNKVDRRIADSLQDLIRKIRNTNEYDTFMIIYDYLHDDKIKEYWEKNDDTAKFLKKCMSQLLKCIVLQEVSRYQVNDIALWKKEALETGDTKRLNWLHQFVNDTLAATIIYRDFVSFSKNTLSWRAH